MKLPGLSVIALGAIISLSLWSVTAAPKAAPSPTVAPSPTPAAKKASAAKTTAKKKKAAVAKSTASPKPSASATLAGTPRPAPAAVVPATRVVSATPQPTVSAARAIPATSPPPPLNARALQAAQQSARRAKPVQPVPTPVLSFVPAQTPPPFPLVDIKKTEPTIMVDLRYATTENFTHRQIYPADMRAMTRPEVMQRLENAQRFLRRYEFNLKIWDAYRPKWAQIELWNASPKNDYVANPGSGAGSLHSWGLAIDATLADRYGGSVKMPTEFDDFTPAAMWKYLGPNEIIRHHLALLQSAMASSGFLGVRSEWWHFTAEDWQQLMPPDEAKRALQAFSEALQQQRKL